MSVALLRELGDNYETYHLYLAAELAKRQEPASLVQPSQMEQYLGEWSEIQALLEAESTFRFCRRYRLTGRTAPDDAERMIPLVDRSRQLVSVAGRT